MDDTQILDLYWQRDEHAIHETNCKYGAYCYSIANHILHNHEDSEECVNDTWIRTWNSIPPSRPQHFSLFLAKITRNLSFNRFQAKTAQKRGEGEINFVLDELSECIATPSNDIESTYLLSELKSSINTFVHTLSKRDCNIFVRRYFFTESVAEIANHYGLTQNNVTVILSRTRNKLKKHLQKEGYHI